MAKSIFTKMREVAQSLNRNNFDLRHTNNSSFPIGKYVPVMCERVMPGDTFRIDPFFSLRLMPLKFPIQTALVARLHFFYVRNKNLWNEWEDFAGNQPTDEMPYHRFAVESNLAAEKEFYKDGGLADYLGIPVNFYGDYGSVNAQSKWKPGSSDRSAYGYDIKDSVIDDIKNNTLKSNDVRYPLQINQILQPIESSPQTDYSLIVNSSYLLGDATLDNFDKMFSGFFNVGLTGGLKLNSTINFKIYHIVGNAPETIRPILVFLSGKAIVATKYVDELTYTVVGNGSDNHYAGSLVLDESSLHIVQSRFSTLSEALPAVDKVGIFIPTSGELVTHWDGQDFMYDVILTETTNVTDLPVNPYETDDCKLCALPARGYESIFNGFYRKTRNNPLIVNGQPEYNQFITNNGSGADATPYHLFDAYWEDDFLTTATQTPQQGIAPLVGVTGTGLFTFQTADGQTVQAQARVGEDGDVLLGIDSYDSQLPDGTLQIIQDTISTGISISDFRNVNALQRWLERNLRVGFRYRELIKAQFGVDVSWKELDMPEFIGGASETFRINQISQTVPTAGTGIMNGALGSYAGQGGLVGKAERIKHYCDDHGYIIGILSVVPVPVYSQLLPKHFLSRGILDYYHPDFAHIGSQPIFMKEVAPLQTFMGSYIKNAGDLEKVSKDMNSTFGYQRAWYDYLSRVDSAHGQFRTSLRDFLLNRTFDDAPELGQDFLTVREEEVNQVFNVTGDTDKVLGELLFKIKASRPIPVYGVPKLES